MDTRLSAFFTARLRRIGYCLLPLALGTGAALLLLLAASSPARAGSANRPAGLPCGATIQACIDAASPGSTVFIPAGDYTESLTLTKTVSLMGALSSTTVLHALPNTRVLTVTGAAINSSVVISGLTFTGGAAVGGFPCDDRCDGGGVLITGTAQPRLSNLRLISNTASYGAGLYANSDLTVSDSSFISNVIGSMIAGGGLYVQGAAKVNNSSFINNYASNGGGLYAAGPATVVGSSFVNNQNSGVYVGYPGLLVTVTDSSFIDNYGSNGGGLFSTYNATVSGTQFINNGANSNGGGLYAGYATVTGSSFISNTAYGGNGGGLDTYESATVSNSSFVANSASSGGGGLYDFNVAMVTVNGSSFVSNSAGLGGGLEAAFLTLGDSSFISNTALQDGGGGVSSYGLTGTADIFIGNSALGSVYGGGGIWSEQLTLTGTQFISNSAQAGGGAVQIEPYPSITSRVVNSLFTRNRSQAGGADLDVGNTGLQLLFDTIADPGLAPGASVYVTGGNLGITDTIFASQTIAVQDTSGSVYQDYNLFFANGTNISGTVSGGANSITGNPAFRDPAHDDYHITVSSAAHHKAIDVGVTTDFEGDPRPFDGGFDIGFDQYLAKLFLPLVRR